MAATPLVDPQTYTCDCCDAEHTTETLQDLVAQGWVRHCQRGVLFIMCPDCEAYFAPVWERRRAKRDAERGDIS